MCPVCPVPVAVASAISFRLSRRFGTPSPSPKTVWPGRWPWAGRSRSVGRGGASLGHGIEVTFLYP